MMDKQQKIKELSELCSNLINTPISLMVQAGLLDKQTAKDVLQTEKIEKLVKEIQTNEQIK